MPEKRKRALWGDKIISLVVAELFTSKARVPAAQFWWWFTRPDLRFVANESEGNVTDQKLNRDEGVNKWL